MQQQRLKPTIPAKVRKRDFHDRFTSLVMIAGVCLCLGYVVMNTPDRFIRYMKGEIGFHEFSTGISWADRKREGKIGPFDEALWPESKDDPIPFGPIISEPFRANRFPALVPIH